jgi:very-short-patch-repair endonuclease
MVEGWCRGFVARGFSPPPLASRAAPLPSRAGEDGEGAGVPRGCVGLLVCPPQLAGEGDHRRRRWWRGVAARLIARGLAPPPLAGASGSPPQQSWGGRRRARFVSISRARRLRSEMSPAEVKLWCELRLRPGGLKFRRQHPVGNYVLDFYCALARLAVEVGGAYHDRGGAPERDAVRDGLLDERGIRTLRIPAVEFYRDLDGVITAIVEAATTPSATPAPPPAR